MVIEGLDNTGKTTLLSKLQADFPELQVVHSIGNKHDPVVIAQAAYDSLDGDALSRLWLYDRVRFIGEYVYRPILRDRPIAFDTHAWLAMLSDYIARPQLLIYCRRPLLEVLHTWKERDQLESVGENLQLVQTAYDTVIQFIGYLFHCQHNGSVLVEYDWYGDPYDKVRNAVERYIKEVS